MEGNRFNVGDRVWVKDPPRGLNWRGQPGEYGEDYPITIGPEKPCWGIIKGFASDGCYDVETLDPTAWSLWYLPDAVVDPFIQMCEEALDE